MQQLLDDPQWSCTKILSFALMRKAIRPIADDFFASVRRKRDTRAAIDISFVGRHGHIPGTGIKNHPTVTRVRLRHRNGCGSYDVSPEIGSGQRLRSGFG